MYETSKATKILKLVLTLLSSPTSREEILHDLQISESTFFNYINTIKEFGLAVSLEGGRYAIDPSSVSKSLLVEGCKLTPQERMHLKAAIDGVACIEEVKNELRRKLLAGVDEAYFINEFLAQEDQAKAYAIRDAMAQQKQLLFVDYLSSSSGTCAGRRVEPFGFSPDFSMIWCFDVDKMEARLFKISRIKQVVPFGDHWQHKNHHIPLPTDIFRIGGCLDKPIALELNNRAFNLLVEEYPSARAFVTKLEGGKFLLQANVAKYDGVARFVLGLMDDVVIRSGKGLSIFVQNKIEKMQQSLAL